MQNTEHATIDPQTLYIEIKEQKVMSQNQFIFLSVISFGLYPIWWIFEAWRFFHAKR